MSKFDYMKDIGLRPNSALRVRKKTDLVIFHYPGSGKQPTTKGMDEYHKSKGHKMIDYNIVVREDGIVEQGRGLDFEGGHVLNGGKTAGMNARSIGICCIGDFNAHEMPAVQLRAVKTLIADIVRCYGFESIDQIKTHKEVAGVGHTDCPGKHFPIDALREYIRNGGKDTMEPTEDSPLNDAGDPYYWEVIVDNLNYRAKEGGKVLGQLHRGDVVYLDMLVANNDWARIKIGGKDGQTAYVWKKYIGE